MPRYIVEDTQPCWVTWSYEIEAESESAAMEKYRNGEHPVSTDPAIGDGIDFLENTTTVRPASF